jgi:hypothetical protein
VVRKLNYSKDKTTIALPEYPENEKTNGLALVSRKCRNRKAKRRKYIVKKLENPVKNGFYSKKWGI